MWAGLASTGGICGGTRGAWSRGRSGIPLVASPVSHSLSGLTSKGSLARAARVEYGWKTRCGGVSASPTAAAVACMVPRSRGCGYVWLVVHLAEIGLLHCTLELFDFESVD